MRTIPLTVGPGSTVGASRDLVVLIDQDASPLSIGYIQDIEKALDDALSSLGFSRSCTSKKQGHVELVYYRFAYTVGPEAGAEL